MKDPTNMPAATLVLLGGSIDLTRWVGMLEAVDESGMGYPRVVGSSTASPVAALVASGFAASEIQQSWEEFAPSDQKEIDANAIVEWLQALLASKGFTKFGDLSGTDSPELKLLVRDVDAKSTLVLPDDAKNLGIEPGQLEIADAVRAAMGIEDLAVFVPTHLGNRRLAGYKGAEADEALQWDWDQILSPGTEPVSVYSEPIVLRGTQSLVTKALNPKYRQVLRVDRMIADSRFAFNVRSTGADGGSGTGDTRVVGLPRNTRFLNLRSLPGEWNLKSAGVLEAARAETKRKLRTLQLAPGQKAIPASLDLGVSIEDSLRRSIGVATLDETRIFPEIEVSDAHPVQGSRMRIKVSLEFQQDPNTLGEVTVPKDDLQHTFDVHLSFGKNSLWGKLTFRRNRGTIEAAEFGDVQVPVLVPDKQRVIPERQLYEIYVNFYLQNRWCGEGVRQVEVRPSLDSPALAVIPTPETPAWRRDLLVERDTAPPDLLIRIKQIGPLEYEWSLFSPHCSLSNDPLQMRTTLTDPPYRYVKDHFEVFSGSDLSDAQIDLLESSCGLIYESAPQGFRRAYRDLCAEVAKDNTGRKRFETIQIVSDEAFIPWELMRVSDPSDVPLFGPEILCVKHSVGRWMAKDSTQLRSSLTVREIAVSASDYKATNVPKVAPLEWAAAERAFLINNPYYAKDIPLQLVALREFLRSGSAEVIHFSCHGETDVQAPERATLKTEDDLVGLRAPLVAMPEVRTGIGKFHPMVFLNACQAAAEGQLIGMVFGWPQAFLQMGATACVAPLWKVVDARAREIAEQFYEQVLPGDEKSPIALGEALRTIRSRWKEKRSLTHLGYTLYGDPMARLTWTRPQ